MIIIINILQTQFITSDNTANGDLTEIRRLYVQGGKVFQQPNSNVAGVSGSAITDSFCQAQKSVFEDTNHFGQKGGMKVCYTNPRTLQPSGTSS